MLMLKLMKVEDVTSSSTEDGGSNDTMRKHSTSRMCDMEDSPWREGKKWRRELYVELLQWVALFLAIVGLELRA
jgi:hypothetical protein